MKRPGWRLAWHRRLLRVPIVGKVLLSLDTSRFASTLAILTSSGVPLLKALDAARLTMGNHSLRRNVEGRRGAGTRRGSPGACAPDPTLFPPLLIHLTASGERSGHAAAFTEPGRHHLER